MRVFIPHTHGMDAFKVGARLFTVRRLVTVRLRTYISGARRFRQNSASDGGTTALVN